MPKVRIYESDNTGASANDLAVIMVPGSAEVVDGVLDPDNCVYIPSTATDLSKYFLDPDYDSRYAEIGSGFMKVDTVHLIEMLIAAGFGIVYKYIPDVEVTVQSSTGENHYVAIDSFTWEDGRFKDVLKTTALYTYDKNADKYKKVSKSATYDEDETYYIVESVYVDTKNTGTGLKYVDWDFLKDKNLYDVKFITTGTFGTVPVDLVEGVTSSLSTYYLPLVMGSEDSASGLTEEKFEATRGTTDYYIFVEDFVEDETSEGSDTGSDEGYTPLPGEFVKVETGDVFDDSIQYYVATTSVKQTTTLSEDSTGDLGQGTQTYSFDFEVANKILPICEYRKDCALLVDLDYYDILNGVYVGSERDDNSGETIEKYKGGVGIVGNELAADYKTALEYNDGDAISTLTKKTHADITEGETDLSSRAYSLIPNATISYGAYTLTVPASFVYLYEYAEVNSVGNSWTSLAGVQRTVVDGTFTPDLTITKYFLDEYVISDAAGVSFNAIVDVRPYGYTIWGDRTLIEQEEARGVQATSYFSIRNLVSDIAHTAYDSAITYTYETNSDVTWLNFKDPINQLLEEMKTSGVLTDFKIKRVATDVPNKMIASIKLFVALPIENYDIYIDLEDAEITISDEA